MCSCKRTISCFSDPLFSTLLTFFALILLSFPRIFWPLLFSPVPLLTGLLLLSLLRLGATQRFPRHIKDKNQIESEIGSRAAAVVPPEEEDRGRDDAVVSKLGGGGGICDIVSCACFEESFVQWNVRAPLEVIYEEYEGEDDKDVSNESDPFTETEPRPVPVRIERYPSLSLYYPETDSDSSSDDEFPIPGAWDSLDSLCFMWDDGEDRDELIEIALDKTTNKMKASSELFQLEEENLIEIDISPTRSDEFPGEV
ncbi:uncharacterized protein LOC111012458 [Momordica charantia]|uniref:Uncharacterized protein LOC111012458 n=1 Tax=Momordica charantia TaxID=3673 RepID=A0A6J1CME6_MOMCH|nr:uncharacterized protein LOC111012458 [Momordica charantia]XP_022142310.1 uncharacterized protein LOC111012458 [Momordica charantia]XP_022142311.1 uncharacterized protein LOC111012458 [Momordica charantia]XP_022142312.1 uncharacterized protein LOC111012458 [Momordica charantia]XP_022142313.1 uncharacterized protein LOC111012458 [Momordica charantia]XP_022142315.1 uncharacterized protein LOC111012458 [Momordica charantia]XP_022142316.1 uncharacterized protein LOC111012458 [Momordica charanti